MAVRVIIKHKMSLDDLLRRSVVKADIPRRRHGQGHGHRLAKHGFSLTSQDPREEIARIGRKDV